MKKKSMIELIVYERIKEFNPVKEYRFRKDRRWRFDFAWPELMLAIELEGGTWIRGRHTTGIGFQNDCIKYNEAVKDGWKVLRYTTSMIDNIIPDIAKIGIK